MDLFDLALYRALNKGGGGGGDITVQSLTATENKTYTAPSGKAYSPVTVNVPNSYGAGDEGKVVSNGALVAQTAHAEVTANGTIDTTLNNSVTVNVSGGGSDGVYVGTDVPSDSIGSDGDYYYRRSNRQYGYSTTPNSGSNTEQSGYEFTANSNITVVGLRANVRGNTTATLYLADANGNIIGQIDDVSCALGWNEAYFDVPVQLTAGSNYIVQVKADTSQMLLYQAKGKTVFNPLITGVNGRYGLLPGTTDSTAIYSADIIIGSGDIYYVIEQYKKISGAWVQIEQ